MLLKETKMSPLNFLIDHYRRVIPKHIRQKASPKIKKFLKQVSSSNTSILTRGLEKNFIGRLNPEHTELSNEIYNLLETYSSTEKYRMLMIVGNVISVDSRVLKSAKSMQDAGFHVVLVGMNPSIEDIQLTNFGSIPALILNSSTLVVTSDPERLSHSIASQLLPIIDTYEPTHVYSHDFFGLAFVSDSIGILNQKRYCHWTHDIHEYVPRLAGAIDPDRLKWADKLEQERLSIPDNIIVVNEKIKNLMADMFSPHQRIDILHNVPRFGQKTFFDLRVTCGLGENQPLGVYTGRATVLRGLDIVIDALEAIPELNIALLSEGAKPYLDSLIKRAREIGAETRLHVFPYLPDAQVTEGIKSADFGIALFKKYGNTNLALPTKLFEYLHANLPVIASDCDEMKTFIHEHKCGEVFESENAEEFVQSIKNVISKSKLNYSIDKKILNSFTWNKQYEPIACFMKNTTNFDKSERQFHGPGPSAGQPRIISAEIRGEGIQAYCINIVSNNSFSYEKDIFFPYKDGIRDPKHMLYWASRRFGLFHFYFRTTSNYILNGEVSPEIYQDALTLRALGCKVIMHFRGTEVSLQSMFDKNNPFAWPETEDPFPGGDALRKHILNRADGLFHKLLVTDPELQSYVENSTILQRAVDFRKIDKILEKQKQAKQDSAQKILRIAHAPSRRALKGTQLVLNSVELLMDQGMDIELDIIEGVTNEEAFERLASADIFIDQMRIGWYGVLATEAMAMGKPTIAYIRDDLVEKLEENCPIIISNPDTLTEDLRRLLHDQKFLAEIGKKSRRFAKEYHCANVVAKKALEIYDTL